MNVPKIKTTITFNKTIKAYNDPNKSLIISYGGSRSGKSFAILQILTIVAINNKKHIHIFGKNLSFLKDSSVKDFIEIMGDLFESKNFNKSEAIYTFPHNGSVIKFFGTDDPHKFKSSSRDIAFLEEINGIKEESFKQIMLRTSGKTICAFNPTHKFYIKNYMDSKDPDVIQNTAIIHSTYLDNPYAPTQTIDNLKLLSKDPNFKRVYMDGEWGTLQGLIFKEDTNWFINYNPFPTNYEWHTFGIDWGYNDPNVIVETAFKDNKIYVKEHFYKTNSLLPDVANCIKTIPTFNYAIADSQNKGAIQELKRNYKLNIKSSKKGPGSVNFGINKLLEYEVYVDSSSFNIIKELRNYSWAMDGNGEPKNEPIDNYNHAIDAIRYSIEGQFKSKTFIKFYG